jgi:aspartate/methionine/tyrosine aminotransferase
VHIERFPMASWLESHDGSASWDISRSGYDPQTLRGLLQGTPAWDELLDTPQRYTPRNGGADLRSLVAQLHPGGGASQVVMTTGATESNWLVIDALIHPGDQVVVIEPTYQQAPLAAKYVGAETRALRTKPEAGWRPDLAELAEFITPRTKLIYLCQPANPTGVVLTDPEVDAILEIASRNGTWVLSDEIYRGTEHALRTWCPSFARGYERAVITGSLSKTYGLPGLRTGWVVANPEIIDAIEARREYITAWLTRPSESVAAFVLDPPVRDRLVDECRQRLASNLPILLDWASSHPADVELATPDATPVAFLGLPTLGSSGYEIARRLRLQGSVLTLPSELFTTGHTAHVRVTYGVTPEHLHSALTAISTLLAGDQVTTLK